VPCRHIRQLSNKCVGVHQSSALSPFLIVVVIDTITRDLQQSIPWTLLYDGDVILSDTTRESLQEQVLLWKSRLSQYGLRLNLNKTEYLEANPITYTIEVD